MLLSPVLSIDLLGILLKSRQLLPLLGKPKLKAINFLLVLEGCLILGSAIHGLLFKLEGIHLSVGALETLREDKAGLFEFLVLGLVFLVGRTHGLELG